MCSRCNRSNMYTSVTEVICAAGVTKECVFVKMKELIKGEACEIRNTCSIQTTPSPGPPIGSLPQGHHLALFPRATTWLSSPGPPLGSLPQGHHLALFPRATTWLSSPGPHLALFLRATTWLSSPGPPLGLGKTAYPYVIVHRPLGSLLKGHHLALGKRPYLCVIV